MASSGERNPVTGSLPGCQHPRSEGQFFRKVLHRGIPGLLLAGSSMHILLEEEKLSLKRQVPHRVLGWWCVSSLGKALAPSRMLCYVPTGTLGLSAAEAEKPVIMPMFVLGASKQGNKKQTSNPKPEATAGHCNLTLNSALTSALCPVFLIVTLLLRAK